MSVLDKEEFRVKLEEINHLVEQKDYKGAMSVVDSIDWRRVKNVRTLCVVGEIYAANKRYEDSKEIFLLAYHRSPIGKNILYRLIEVSLKMGDLDEAAEFYNEFREVAPNDNTQYVLKYKILKAKKAPLEEQIKVLAEYKEKEFTEKWSYELAKLYYKAGDKEKCLSLCNEMILWFSEGSYVMKALDLKMRMGALEGAEKEKYEQQFVPKLITPEEAKALKDSGNDDLDLDNSVEEKESQADYEDKEMPRIDMIRIRNDRDLEGAETLQEKISKGLRDIFGSKKTDIDFPDEELGEEKEDVQKEMIRTTSDKEEFENVPDLEKEGEKPVKKQEEKDSDDEKRLESEEELVFSGSLKMPELDIPDSMKKVDLKDALNMPKIPEPDSISEIMENEPLDDSFDFNLEDTILAAASAQGIDIPKTEEKPAVQEEPAEEIVPEEEEEILSEEDLRRAEEEFLRGPVKKENTEEPEEKDMNTAILESESDLEMISSDDETEEEPEEAEPETDPRDIIPRERELTEDEEKIFTYFVKVPGMKEQLIDALCDTQMAAADGTSQTGNVIVMGARETGKTRLIAGLIPAICKQLNLEAARTAYVFADQINGKDIDSIVKKLAGGFLVIEDANQLDAETAELLDQAMEGETQGLTVIIEDEKIGMRKFIARYPKLAKKFTSMINIPVFTNDELVNFAKVYTVENGYKIDQMGMLALYNSIGANQKEDEPMSIGVVKEIIDAAIMKSQRGLLKRNKRRVDQDGYIMLYEKDFN